MGGFLFAAMAICLLSSCVLRPPAPRTFEEQQAWMAKQQCMQEASDMNPEAPFSTNPYWNDYFIMCMNRFGIPDSVIRRMWY